jgi:predicted DNA repair protein MutK
VGAGLLRLAPRLMQCLSVAGMAAMFLVGGGILVHGVAPLHHAIAGAAAAAGGAIAEMVLNGLVGVVVGAAALALVSLSIRFQRGADLSGGKPG